MANFSAQGPIAIHGTPQDSGGDTEQRYPVLTRAKDVDGGEWVYVKGVAGAVEGSWVTYDEAGTTALLVPAADGMVGVMGADVVAGDFGWAQVWGHNTHALSVDVADNAELFIDADTNVNGDVDDAVVNGELILGARSRSADDTSDTAIVGFIDVQLNYPEVNGQVANTALI